MVIISIQIRAKRKIPINLFIEDSTVTFLEMARRAFKIPPFKGKNIMWYGLGALGLAGLYYILANRDIGIPLFDQPLEAIGDITGLEGRGPQYLPQLFGGAPVPVPSGPVASEPGWGDWRFTNAYQVENYDEFRFSNAYKNE